ncbi:hypothetical protein [Cupriavidus oxalaticus]|jgi:hypothetical protein|uniref:hypothetical protein n=1 Tax=Cupriavidus oxalaticus TaxID=96344 RepID=UPI004034430A
MPYNRDWAVANALKLVTSGLESGAIQVGAPEQTGSSPETGKDAGKYLASLVKTLADELQQL